MMKHFLLVLAWSACLGMMGSAELPVSPNRMRTSVYADSVSGTTYWVDGSSPSATDAGPGTRRRPWKTISRALVPRVLSPGDTVIVRKGTYPESLMPSVSGKSPASRIVIRAYRNERVVVTGADRLPSKSVRFDPESGEWIIDGYAPLEHPYGDPKYERDLVVVDGILMMPAPATGLSNPGRFLVEAPTASVSRLRIRPPAGVSTHPGDHVFELGSRSSIFRPVDPDGHLTECGASESAGWLHVIGLTFRHAANKAQSGAVCAGSRGTIFENVTVEATNGVGIIVTGDNHVLEGTRSLFNGQAGINGSCSHCRLVDSESSFNNWRGHDPFWEAGGGKWAASSDVRLIRFRAVENNGPGFWLDGDNSNVIISESRFERNQLAGIMVELRAVNVRIRDNDIVRTRRLGWSGAGILIQAAGGVEISGNHIMENDGAGIWLRSDDRERGGGNVLTNNLLVDNVVSAGQDHAQITIWGRDREEALSNTLSCNQVRASGEVTSYVVQTDDKPILESSDSPAWQALWGTHSADCPPGPDRQIQTSGRKNES